MTNHVAVEYPLPGLGDPLPAPRFATRTFGDKSDESYRLDSGRRLWRLVAGHPKETFLAYTGPMDIDTKLSNGRFPRWRLEFKNGVMVNVTGPDFVRDPAVVDLAEDNLTAAELFSRTGRALFGEHFKAPLANALNVSVDRVDDWSKGRGNVPPEGVWQELAALVNLRQIELNPLRDALLRAAQRSQDGRQTYVGQPRPF